MKIKIVRQRLNNRISLNQMIKQKEKKKLIKMQFFCVGLHNKLKN